jgi:hypothetical protein
MTSILGKLFIVLLIIFYTSIHKIYGLLVCLIAIFFYQLDSTQWLTEGFFDTSSLYNNQNERGCQNECGCVCKKCNNCLKNNQHLHNNQTYLTVIDLEDNLTERRKSEFQKNHCLPDGTLTYKGFPIKKDLSDIIFPEIKYGDEYNICNLCDKNCDFTIVK